MEEFLFRETQTPWFLLWINQPSIFIGKNQVPWAEIQALHPSVRGLPILRRPSGGGAVYHDPGNLSFSFITPFEERPAADFFLAPIIRFLETLGIRAERAGKSGLAVNGAKFSGSAQAFSRQRAMHHGTILFDANLAVLDGILDSDRSGYVTHSVPSVRSRVRNLKPLMPVGIQGISDFASRLQTHVLGYNPTSVRMSRQPPVDELRFAAYLEKHRSEDWIFGSSPPYSVRRSVTQEGFLFEAETEIEKGLIADTSVSVRPLAGNSSLKPPATQHHPNFCGLAHRPEVLLPVLSSSRFQINNTEVFFPPELFF